MSEQISPETSKMSKQEPNAQYSADEDARHVRSALETLSDPLLINVEGVGLTRMLNLVNRMRDIAATALLHLPASPDTSTDRTNK